MHFLPSHNEGNLREENLEDLLNRVYPVETLTSLFKAYGEAKVRAPDAPRLKKADIARAFSRMEGDAKASRALFARFPESAQKVYALLTWEGGKKLSQVEKAVGETVARINLSEGGYWNSFRGAPFEYDPALGWIIVQLAKSAGYQSFHYRPPDASQLSISLPPALRRWFRSFLPKPAGSEYTPLSGPPTGEGVRVFEPAADASVVWPLVMSALARNQFTLTKAGRPTKGAMRKFSKASGMQEFFTDPSDADRLQFLRIENLFHAIGELPAGVRKEVEGASFPVERFFGKHLPALLAKPTFLGTASLPHFEFNLSTRVQNADTNFLQVFRDLPEGLWISANNVFSRARLSDKWICPVPADHVAVKVLEETRYGLESHFLTGLRLEDDEVFETITASLLKGAAFLLASFGLLDLAYATPPRHPRYQIDSTALYLSPADGLAGLRLNALGAFVLGKRAELPQASMGQEAATIHLSPERLVANVENLDPVTEQTLMDYMERLAPHVFLLTRRSLIGTASFHDELLRRITSFRKHLGVELPPLWEDFLRGLETRATPLHSGKFSYHLFEVSDDPEVRHHFLHDPVLRRNVLKVEGGRVAIDQTNLSRVRNRLRELGYFFETFTSL